MDVAFRLCQNIYKSKVLSYQAKLRHYNTAVKPECLYAAETVARKGLMEVEKKERKFLRKILGPKKSTANEFRPSYILRSNKELYEKCEKISNSIKKRRLAFYGHIKRMESNRIANRILIFQENRKTQTPWVKEVHKDLQRCGIKSEDVGNREVFKKKIAEVKDLSEEKSRRSFRIFSEEERTRASQRMKEYWRRRKELEKVK